MIVLSNIACILSGRYNPNIPSVFHIIGRSSAFSCWHAVSSRSRGVSGIEFALVAPLLALLLAMTVDIALAVRGYLAAHAAAAAGAHYVLASGWDSAGIVRAVGSATSQLDVIASPLPTMVVACPTASGSGLVNVPAGTACTDGQLARRFITVYASVPRKSVMGANLGMPAQLQAFVTVQVP